MNLRKAAQGKPCILCRTEDGTTTLHHIQVPDNHGTGSKPEDFPWGVRLCAECHRYIHHEGRGDHKAMCLALGRQMIQYRDEGVLQWAREL